MALIIIISDGMILPARKTLYTLVSRSVRYKGKNAVDTVVLRVGEILSILSISLGVNLPGFGIIWAPLEAITGFIGWRLANRVEKSEREFELKLTKYRDKLGIRL